MEIVYDIRPQLIEFVKKYPSQRNAAEALGITPPYLSDLLKGNRTISEKIAEAIGYRREIVFFENSAQEVG